MNRLTAVARLLILVFFGSGAPAKTSVIEKDWSIRKRIQAGLARSAFFWYLPLDMRRLHGTGRDGLPADRDARPRENRRLSVRVAADRALVAIQFESLEKKTG